MVNICRGIAMKIKEGHNGAGGVERYYEIFRGEAVWRRERRTAIGRAFEYWHARRLDATLPRETDLDDRRLADLVGRVEKIDVRPRFPGDYSLILIAGSDVYSFRRFRSLPAGRREDLTLDLVACLEQREPLYLVAEQILEAGRRHVRSVLLPALAGDGAIGWIYRVAIGESGGESGGAEPALPASLDAESA